MKVPDWSLSGDTLTVTFPTEPQPIAVVLDASAVDHLLQNLGRFRPLMQPFHPPDWSPGLAVEAIPDPRWYSEAELVTGDTLLHLRDPRYGWLHYVLPPASATELARLLAEQQQARRRGPGPAKPS